MNIKPIAKDSSEYPANLAKSSFAVSEIWMLGDDVFEEDEFCLAMVGTRSPSKFATPAVSAMVKSIAQNKVRIISGLAQGVDSLCHIAAIGNGLKTTAVLAQGLDVPLNGSQRIVAEKILKSGGSLISLFPPSTPAYLGNFIKRNLIITGMSNATILVESRVKGGAMHTAAFCVRENKPLFALPGTPLQETSGGCNKLIYDKKANSIWNINELPNLLGLPTGLFNVQKSKSLPIWVKPNTVSTIDEICEQTGKQASEILSILTELELQGLCFVQNGQDVVFS